MDRLEFRRVSETHSDARHSSITLHPVINGRLLRDVAADVERSVASRSDRKLVGAYWALSADSVSWPSRHFLGEPAEDFTWFEDGDTILLGCRCGEPGCWPLTARIDLEPGLVTWSNFRHGHRDWDLSSLGPFRFRECDYVAALQGTARQ